jgi:hypothetical protein
MNNTCLHPQVFFLCSLYILPWVHFFFRIYVPLFSFYLPSPPFVCFSLHTVARKSKIFLFSAQYMQCLQAQLCYFKSCFKYKETKSYAPNLLIRSSINCYEDTLNKSGTGYNKGFLCDFDPALTWRSFIADINLLLWIYLQYRYCMYTTQNQKLFPTVFYCKLRSKDTVFVERNYALFVIPLSGKSVIFFVLSASP